MYLFEFNQCGHAPWIEYPECDSIYYKECPLSAITEGGEFLSIERTINQEPKCCRYAIFSSFSLSEGWCYKWLRLSTKCKFIIILEKLFWLDGTIFGIESQESIRICLFRGIFCIGISIPKRKWFVWCAPSAIVLPFLELDRIILKTPCLPRRTPPFHPNNKIIVNHFDWSTI